MPGILPRSSYLTFKEPHKAGVFFFFSIPTLLMSILHITSFCHMFVIYLFFNPKSNMDTLNPTTVLKMEYSLLPFKSLASWFSHALELGIMEICLCISRQAWGGTKVGYLGCHLCSQEGSAHGTKRHFSAPLCSHDSSHLGVKRKSHTPFRWISPSLRGGEGGTERTQKNAGEKK